MNKAEYLKQLSAVVPESLRNDVWLIFCRLKNHIDIARKYAYQHMDEEARRQFDEDCQTLDAMSMLLNRIEKQG